MSIDWNQVSSLLHAAEKTTQWPTLHGIRDRALNELDEINVEATKEMKTIRERIEKAREEAEARRLAAGATGATGSAAHSGFGDRLSQRFGSKEGE